MNRGSGSGRDYPEDLSAEEISLVLALLPSDVRLALKSAGLINSKPEWLLPKNSDLLREACAWGNCGPTEPLPHSIRDALATRIPSKTTKADRPSESDVDSEVMRIWNLSKPSEAVDLKLIVMDPDGRFAGTYSADDHHGDRYFVLKQRPRKKDWQMVTNLASFLEGGSDSGLGKSARETQSEYREILAKAVYRYEPNAPTLLSTQAKASSITTSVDRSLEPKLTARTQSPVSTQNSSNNPNRALSALKGKALLARVKELGDRKPEELARLCGYVVLDGGVEAGDTESYYEALFDAHSS